MEAEAHHFQKDAAADGSEIRGSPIELGSFSHYLQGFSTIPGGFSLDF